MTIRALAFVTSLSISALVVIDLGTAREQAKAAIRAAKGK